MAVNLCGLFGLGNRLVGDRQQRIFGKSILAALDVTI
jgi:hypothetical protein